MKNKGASVRAKLLSIARNENVNFDFIVLRYMQERLLYRISQSKYRDNLILKGGLFFLIADMLNPRVTTDIDLLGLSLRNNEQVLRSCFVDIVNITYNDGVSYKPENIKLENIKEDADYEGIRLFIPCKLDVIQKKLQVDIGFGDVIYPESIDALYQTMLDEHSINIMLYSVESVISEKFEAIVKLSFANSRMKDFYDIYNIIDQRELDGHAVKEAILITFNNRGTNLEAAKQIFQDEFMNNRRVNEQWKIFIRKMKEISLSLSEVLTQIAKMLNPILKSIEENSKFDKKWNHIKKTWK